MKFPTKTALAAACAATACKILYKAAGNETKRTTTETKNPKSHIPYPLRGYPLEGILWFRHSTREWILEICGTVNDTHFTCRHVEPEATKPEDVSGFPALYERLESLYPKGVQDALNILSEMLKKEQNFRQTCATGANTNLSDERIHTYKNCIKKISALLDRDPDDETENSQDNMPTDAKEPSDRDRMINDLLCDCYLITKDLKNGPMPDLRRYSLEECQTAVRNMTKSKGVKNSDGSTTFTCTPDIGIVEKIRDLSIAAHKENPDSPAFGVDRPSCSR